LNGAKTLSGLIFNGDKNMSFKNNVEKIKIAKWSELQDRAPAYALVANVDVVVVRYDENVSVLFGRCLHRGALLSDGHIDGNNLICGLHGWDYRLDTGISEYNNKEILKKFDSWIDKDEDAVFVDENQIRLWEKNNPQAYYRDSYLGLYADHHGAEEEPFNNYIQHLAKHGLKKWGHHGKVSAMGVPLTELPQWSDIQILTGQLATPPLDDDANIRTELVIGPNAKKPLTQVHHKI
jgi:methylamine---glutamate N-methyltransferase subunit C